MTRRGRPRADRLALVEEVAALLIADPGLSANRVQRIVGAQRAEVLRAVRAVRGLLKANPCPDSFSGPPSSETRFPYCERAAPEEVPGP